MVGIRLGDAFNGQFTTVLFGQSPGYEKTQSRTGPFFPLGNLWSPSSIKNVPHIMGGDARAIVPDANEKMGGVFGQHYFYALGSVSDAWLSSEELQKWFGRVLVFIVVLAIGSLLLLPLWVGGSPVEQGPAAGLLERLPFETTQREVPVSAEVVRFEIVGRGGEASTTEAAPTPSEDEAPSEDDVPF